MCKLSLNVVPNLYNSLQSSFLSLAWPWWGRSLPKGNHWECSDPDWGQMWLGSQSTFHPQCTPDAPYTPCWLPTPSWCPYTPASLPTHLAVLWCPLSPLTPLPVPNNPTSPAGLWCPLSPYSPCQPPMSLHPCQPPNALHPCQPPMPLHPLLACDALWAPLHLASPLMLPWCPYTPAVPYAIWHPYIPAGPWYPQPLTLSAIPNAPLMTPTFPADPQCP